MPAFLNPWFLLGLAAIGVPVALHLLHRRRLPIVEFPLTRLLLRIERSRQPRRRLNRILLLIARSAFLAVLSLALARIVLMRGPALAATGPVATAVVIDDSLSMGAMADGAPALQRGKAAADAVLASLPEGSSAALVLASRAEGAPDGDLSTDVDGVRKGLADVAPTLRRERLGRALGAAANLLARSPLPDRRVLLVSDMARHAFEGVSLPHAEGQRPRLISLVPGPPPSRPDLGVSGLDVSDLPDGRLRVTVRVAAWGGAARAPLSVSLGGWDGSLRVAAKADVEVGEGASAERRFDVTAPSDGYVRVEAALPPDVLPGDDVRAAVHHVARRPRLLVVDGDPQNLALGSETFYVEKALAPDVGLDLDSRIVTVPELDAVDLSQWDAVALCNVPELTEARAHTLGDAVARGLGLVVALGTRVHQAAYNGHMASLLPATLAMLRVADPPLAVDAAHSDAPFALQHARFHELLTLEPGTGARVACRLSDGAPLVVEGSPASGGGGRVIVFASTLDRDWNDAPIQPSFLPFLRGLVARVTAPREGRVLPPVFVGEPVDLSGVAAAEPGPEPLTVRLPGGTPREVPADGRLPEGLDAGAWLVMRGHVPVAALAVVTDPAESDLARLSADESAQLLGGAFDVEGTTRSESGSAGARAGVAVWKGLLVALGVLLAAEAWLARSAA